MSAWDGFLPSAARLLVPAFLIAWATATAISARRGASRRAAAGRDASPPRRGARPLRPGAAELERAVAGSARSALAREGIQRRLRLAARDLAALQRGLDDEAARVLVQEGRFIDDAELEDFLAQDFLAARRKDRAGAGEGGGFAARAEAAVAALERVRAGVEGERE